MSPEMISDVYRVGAGLSVRFSLRDGRFDAQWLPRVPTEREWKLVVDAYRDARHEFLGELAKRVGGAVICVEVP